MPDECDIVWNSSTSSNEPQLMNMPVVDIWTNLIEVDVQLEVKNIEFNVYGQNTFLISFKSLYTVDLYRQLI